MDISISSNLYFKPQGRMPQEELLSLRVAGEADLQLSYRHAGQGQSLIWLHWIWGESGWGNHLQRLASRFRLYAPDLPGYGRSTLREWVCTPRDLAVLVLGFLDALEIQRPTIVGSCLGGWVAAELALLNPERLGRLVLIDPLGLVLDKESLLNIFPMSPARLPGYLFTETDSAQTRPGPAELSSAALGLLQAREKRTPLVFDSVRHSDTLAQNLPLLTTPTLVLWGEHDPLLDPRHADLWTSLLPNAQHAIIPGAGHLPYVENCTAVVEIVEAFALAEYVEEELS